MLNFIFLHN